MGLNHFIVLFLIGFVHFSLGKDDCPECAKGVDVNDPKLQQYMIRTVHGLKNVIPKGVTGEKEMNFIRFTGAQQKAMDEFSYQFEAMGMNTNKMYDCNLTVVRTLDESSQKITEYSCDLVPNPKKMLLPGEDIVVDVNTNNDLEGLKSFLGQEISKSQRSQYLMVVMQYLKATFQVVEGLLLKTTVQVGLTDCYLYENGDANDCNKKLKGLQFCDVKVWLKPWMKYKEVVEVKCQPLMPSVCAGCPVEKDPNSSFIKQHLERTLYKLNEGSQTNQKLTLVKINKATSQVVNGVKLTIYFDAQKSNRNYNCKTVIMLPAGSVDQVVQDFTCTPFAEN